MKGEGNDKQTGQNVATGESGSTSIEAACARGYHSSLNSKLPKNEKNLGLCACSEEPSLRVPWASVSSVAKSSSCLHSARLLRRLKQQTSEQSFVQSCLTALHSGTQGLGCPRLPATSCRVLEEQPQTPCYLSPSQCSALSLPGSACLFLRNPSQSAAVVSDFCRLKENPGAGESFLGRSKSQPNIKEIL